MAIVKLSVSMPAQNPTTAPISIIPSTPRFMTPHRLATISPRAAKRTGTATVIALAIERMTTLSFILLRSFQRLEWRFH